MNGSLWPRIRPDSDSTRQLLKLAWPLIISNSFWNLQIMLDRIFLGMYSQDAMSASQIAALLFWVPISLMQATVGYVTTFVAQYTGANRRERVGASVWQALHLSLWGGLTFLLLLPLAGPVLTQGGHSPALVELEILYFQCLCFTAMPTLVTAAATSFFTGRGESRIALLINAIGLVTNSVLTYAWIFGKWGLPAWGIVGAGCATIVGMSVSAGFALLLLHLPHYRSWFPKGSWRLDGPLLGRLLYYGLPSGVFMALDTLAFTVFTWLVGLQGTVELAATTIAFTLNLFVFMPAFAMSQAVGVLVGQRLGENRPDLAERHTWTGLWITLGVTCLLGSVYVLIPEALASLFHSDAGETSWEAVRAHVPYLLRFVALYCLFDSANLVFSHALRGAGDTRFVTMVALTLSWPVMVIPTGLAWCYSWGLYASWTFASLYILCLALAFLLRFLQGQWRTMRVIESAPPLPGLETSSEPAPLFPTLPNSFPMGEISGEGIQECVP